MPYIKHACSPVQVADCKADLAAYEQERDSGWQEAEAAKQQRDSAVAAADEASQLAAELSTQVQQQRDNLLQLQTRKEVCSLSKTMVFGSALLGLHKVWVQNCSALAVSGLLSG